MELKKNNKEPNKIVFSRQTFTAIEKDLIYHLINQLPENLDPKEWSKDKIFKVEFKKDILKEQRPARLRPALQKLNSRSFEFVDMEQEHIKYSSIFPVTKLENGIITIGLSGEYLQDFTDLKKGYSVYSLEEILSLTGLHAKRLFEMFNAYVNRKSNIFIIKVDELKRLLAIENKYPNITLLKKRVIEPSIEQINDKTNLNVSYEYLKPRKTLQFTVARKNPQYKLDIENNTKLDNNQQRAIDWCKGLDFEEKQIYQIINEPEKLEKFIKWVINYQAEIKNKTIPKTVLRGKFYNYLKTGFFE